MDSSTFRFCVLTSPALGVPDSNRRPGSVWQADDLRFLILPETDLNWNRRGWQTRLLLAVLYLALNVPVLQGASLARDNQESLAKFLLGKDVKALIQMPASKEGLDIYYDPPKNKRSDERGIDFGDLTKWLKEKGVGIDRGQEATITNVKIDNDKIEIHFDGGGQGRRGSNHANKVNAAYKRAGGSRVNFRYQRKLTVADLQPSAFLPFMGRIFDVSAIELKAHAGQMSPEYQAAINSHSVREGMTYEMVLLSMGEPEQKKVDSNDAAAKFVETWYYFKNGRRSVLTFEDGHVARVKVF